MSSTPEAGERLVRSLAAQGVDYLFGTFGTDHPPIIRGLSADEGPTLVHAPDEMVGASAAHGYAQVTGDPQAVLVHVDVGTTNLGPALHNAARSRVPMLVLSGRTPHTTRGEQPGGRSVFVHYYQDVFDQPGLVREYAKWAYELETPANVEQVLARALDRARVDPPGPSYLALPREVLRGTGEPADSTAFSSDTDRTRTAASRETLSDLVERIETADHPLLVTTCLGRDANAVSTLEEFAVTTGVPVVEAAPSFRLNFPRDHPLHLGFAAEPHLPASDLIIVANSDVPWVPARETPTDDATVVRIDPDPHASQYPLPDAPADIAIA
ncbi:MAG: thiamine pyrophosphate-binding protein, partial [Halobacteriales archaeon]|nr:thiamine pyrophosphate-binding protein [Halobacteriales archaeon]